MNQVARLFVTAALTAIVTVFVVLFVSRPTHAQVGPTAVCASTNEILSPTDWNKAPWINQQLKTGKTHFIQVGPAVICAW
jgi:hypothetical protein